jgi:hypothetical protein
VTSRDDHDGEPRRGFVLDDDQWAEFNARLARPPDHKPRLAELLSDTTPNPRFAEVVRRAEPFEHRETDDDRAALIAMLERSTQPTDEQDRRDPGA